MIGRGLAGPVIAAPAESLAGMTAIHLAAEMRRHEAPSWWPYLSASCPPESAVGRVTLTAIPYYAWGNREHGAMRVWLRTA